MSIPRVVGAYAAMPGERAEQEEFYDLLRNRASGIEVPFIHGLHDDLPWLASQLKAFPHSVVTAIGGAMTRLGQDPIFGIASPDEEGRQRGLAFVRDIASDIARLHDLAGPVIRYVQLHSAPSRTCSLEAFRRSLPDVVSILSEVGVDPVIEHCDDVAGPTGEKMFLSLEDEMTACEEAGIKITVNWGRSVLERHDPARPAEHVATLVERNLLGGIMFSGIGSEPTQYGPAWGDAHLPLVDDEETSLMTAEAVESTYAAAGGHQLYEGVKIQVPAVSPTVRAGLIDHVFAHMI